MTLITQLQKLVGGAREEGEEENKEKERRKMEEREGRVMNGKRKEEKGEGWGER